jgi:hypothetical protein
MSIKLSWNIGKIELEYRCRLQKHGTDILFSNYWVGQAGRSAVLGTGKGGRWK